MEKFKVGVIGCGRISSVYLDAFRNLQDIVEVCFAVDKDRERAEFFASKFDGCGYSDRIEDLLVQPLDVVHVLTPHFLHKEHVIRCLRAGFHVLTEKPIAITAADAEYMIQTAKGTGKKLGVISQNRYIEGIQTAKKMIEEGKLGRLTGAWSTLNWWRPPSYYQCDWKGSWEKEGGGVVIDQAIHSLDLVRYLMGCNVISVHGHIDRRVLTNIEVEDVADAAITFENGAVYSFYACNYYTSNSPIRVEISGEKGAVLLTKDIVTIHVDGSQDVTVHPEAVSDFSGKDYWGIHHLAQLKDFYSKLAEGKPVPIDPEEAKKTLEMVLAIYRSSKENRKVFLKS